LRPSLQQRDGEAALGRPEELGTGGEQFAQTPGAGPGDLLRVGALQCARHRRDDLELHRDIVSQGLRQPVLAQIGPVISTREQNKTASSPPAWAIRS
jgi:hypothetical protein